MAGRPVGSVTLIAHDMGLYRRLGWRAIFQQFSAGALVTVMGRDLTACGPSTPPDSNA